MCEELRCSANTLFFSFSDSFSKTSDKRATGLVISRGERHGGGSRFGHSPAKDWLSLGPPAAGGKKRRPCGPHACLSSPASSHRPLWVSRWLGAFVCVRVDVDVPAEGRKHTSGVLWLARFQGVSDFYLFASEVPDPVIQLQQKRLTLSLIIDVSLAPLTN